MVSYEKKGKDREKKTHRRTQTALYEPKKDLAVSSEIK